LKNQLLSASDRLGDTERAMKSKDAECQSTVAALRGDNARLEQENADLRKSAENDAKTCDRLRQEIAQANSERERCENSLRHLERQRVSECSDFDAQRERYDSLLTSYSELQNRLDLLQSARDENLHLVMEFQKCEKSWQAELRRLLDEANYWRSQYEEAKEVIELQASTVEAARKTASASHFARAQELDLLLRQVKALSPPREIVRSVLQRKPPYEPVAPQIPSILQDAALRLADVSTRTLNI
jgi:chromosome segregation ATPase